MRRLLAAVPDWSTAGLDREQAKKVRVTLLRDEDNRVVARHGQLTQDAPISAKEVHGQPKGGRKLADP